jgi:hypothetical protein
MKAATLYGWMLALSMVAAPAATADDLMKELVPDRQASSGCRLRPIAYADFCFEGLGR